VLVSLLLPTYSSIMVRRNLLALLQLCLWLALVGISHAKQQRQLQTTRLGAGRFVKKNDSKDSPAPTIEPSAGPTTDPPSVAPSSTPPIVAPPAAATTNSTEEQDLDLSSSLFTNSSSSTTPAPTPPAELLALVLNAWVDPTVLAMALRTYAHNNVVHIQDTRQVDDDGTMYLYEISVHDTDPWLNDPIALAAFIRYAFDDSGVGEEDDSTPLLMVQITRLEDYDDASTKEQEAAAQAAAQQEDDDDKLLLIVIMVVSWSLVCCCLGIAILLIPNLLRYRQELREQWSYNASKERQVTGAIQGPSHTHDDTSEEEEEHAWGERQLRHSMS